MHTHTHTRRRPRLPPRVAHILFPNVAIHNLYRRYVQCLFQGSRDNMSAVLVTFPGLTRSNKGEGVQGRRVQRAVEDSEVWGIGHTHATE